MTNSHSAVALAVRDQRCDVSDTSSTGAASSGEKNAEPKITRKIGFAVSRTGPSRLTIRAGEGVLSRSMQIQPSELGEPRIEQLPFGTMRFSLGTSGEVLAFAQRQTGEAATLVIANDESMPPRVDLVWGDALNPTSDRSLEDSLLGDHMVDRNCAEYMSGKQCGTSPIQRARSWLWKAAGVLLVLGILRLCL